jgi:hypothetical protein
MRADAAYEELIRRVREESLLVSVEALLEWDEETYLPRGGVQGRSEQLALLAGLVHDRGTDPRIGELLAAVEGSALLADPESVASSAGSTTGTSGCRGAWSPTSPAPPRWPSRPGRRRAPRRSSPASGPGWSKSSSSSGPKPSAWATPASRTTR